MTVMEYLEKFKLLATAGSMIVVFTVGGWTAYTDIYKTIEQGNTKIIEDYEDAIYQLELTQKSLLKAQVRDLELYPCKTSRTEWTDYNILFSQYNTIRKKHNPLLNEMDLKPMERLKKDSCKCYKGVCDE